MTCDVHMAYTRPYKVYTCTYVVHGYYLLYAYTTRQLAAWGTKEHALLGWKFFSLEKNILKTMMFSDVTIVLNNRKHLKMVIWSVPDSVSLVYAEPSDWALPLYTVLINCKWWDIEHVSHTLPSAATRYMPLHTCLYWPCNMYVLCCCTGISHSVQTGLR